LKPRRVERCSTMKLVSLEKGPSLGWGAFRLRWLPEVNYDIMGSHKKRCSNRSW
jgi:hypothetical protein